MPAPIARRAAPCLLALLPLLSCSHYQITGWRPPAPDTRAASPPMAVQLDLYRGLGLCDGQRMERIAALIQRVLNSAVFRCQVRTFDQGRRPWLVPDGACVADPSRAAATTLGYAPSLCSGEVSRCGPLGSACTPSGDVLTRLVQAMELEHDSKASGLQPSAELGVANLDIRLRHRPSSAMGVTDLQRGFTWTRAANLKEMPDHLLAGHLIHEYTHRLGYCDSKGKDVAPLVSYAVGYLACVEAARLVEPPLDPQCCGRMLGAERPEELGQEPQGACRPGK